MKIPVADKFFDFAICTHTLEDLRTPTFLMDELGRVAKRGYVEVPSRLAEQTIGLADRANRFQGYNHHKWIVDFEDALVFYDKDESLYGPMQSHAVPLRAFERIAMSGHLKPSIEYFWNDSIAYRICEASDVAREKARAFRATLPILPSDMAIDSCMRLARRTRDKLKGRDPWAAANMRVLSEPFSALDLC